jgi:hypothetical protein
MTWALGQHPNISLQPESNWMPGIAKAALDAYRVGSMRGDFSQLSNAKLTLEAFMAHFGNAVDAISRECFERRVEQFVPNFRQRESVPASWAHGARLIHSPKDPKSRWVDGTPDYTFYTYELGLLFPDCQFIHILRRPDQVVNSLAHFENAGSDGRNFDMASALDVWTKHTLAARDAGVFFGQPRLLRVDNADLANDGEAVLRQCFEFLGEAYCERAVAALQAKMNSSKASDKQADTSSQMRDRRDFRAAVELYEELRDTQVPTDPDPTSLVRRQRDQLQPEKKTDGYLASRVKAVLRRLRRALQA